MKQIKIYKEFWDKIVSGEKKYEFRKLSKGLETGTYEFVSVEKIGNCPKCMKEFGWDDGYSDTTICTCGHKVFGTAKLTPVSINSHSKIRDGETYDFVKKNYIDKNIDFVAYTISEVKESV